MKRILNTRPGRLVGQLRKDAPKEAADEALGKLESKGLNDMVVFEPGKTTDIENDVFERLKQSEVFTIWLSKGWLVSLDVGESGPEVETSSGSGTGAAGSPELKDICNSKLSKILDDGGFDVARVAEAKVEDLTALSGIGDTTAVQLIEAARTTQAV
jgi:hypothetical protein